MFLVLALVAGFSGKIYTDAGFALVDVSEPFESSLVPFEPVPRSSLQICFSSLLALVVFFSLWVSAVLVCAIWLLVYESCLLVLVIWLLVYKSCLLVLVIWLLTYESFLLVWESFWLVSFLLLWRIWWMFCSSSELLLVVGISHCLSLLDFCLSVSDFCRKKKDSK